jgi:hypothetical protein
MTSSTTVLATKLPYLIQQSRSSGWPSHAPPISRRAGARLLTRPAARPRYTAISKFPAGAAWPRSNDEIGAVELDMLP